MTLKKRSSPGAIHPKEERTHKNLLSFLLKKSHPLLIRSSTERNNASLADRFENRFFFFFFIIIILFFLFFFFFFCLPHRTRIERDIYKFVYAVVSAGWLTGIRVKRLMVLMEYYIRDRRLYGKKEDGQTLLLLLVPFFSSSLVISNTQFRLVYIWITMSTMSSSDRSTGIALDIYVNPPPHLCVIQRYNPMSITISSTS